MLLEHLQQPIVHAHSRRVAGVELLARFVDAGPPPLVLGNNVADWLMLDMGGLSRVRYNHPVAEPHMVFVNLSRHIACSPWAMDVFLIACRRTMELAQVSVIVEIDEESNLSDHNLVALVQRIRTFGLRVAMDDHRGRLSCYHRSRLNCWDIIKVCSQKRPIEAVCDDVHRLSTSGVPVVAEAIETKEMYEATRDAGATYIQGWYTGKPSPILIYPQEQEVQLGRKPLLAPAPVTAA